MIDRARTEAMKKTEEKILEEFRYEKAWRKSSQPECAACPGCSDWTTEYVDWLETKLGWEELSAESWRKTTVLIEGTQAWETSAHAFRRTMTIILEELILHEKGEAVASAGYLPRDSVAEGYR